MDIASANDIRAITETMEGIKGSLSPLLVISALLFFWTLFMLPVSLLLRPAPWVLWLEASLFLLVWATATIIWLNAHRTLLPNETGDRLEELLVFLLFPPSALHALGRLTRRLFASFESVSLITALVPSSAQVVLTREYIRLRAAASLEGGDDFKDALKARIRILERLATESGLDLRGLHKPASAGDETVCPLCSAAYRSGISRCADCGIPLGTTEGRPVMDTDHPMPA